MTWPKAFTPASWLLPGIAILAVGALAGLAILQYRQDLSSIQRGALQTATAITQVVDARLLAAQSLALAMAASSPELNRGDLGGFHSAAKRALEATDVADGIVILDESGQQLVNTQASPDEQLPVSHHPEHVQQIFRTGRPKFSDLFLGSRTQQQIIAADAPVFRSGRVVYDLTAIVNAQRFAEIVKSQRFPLDWYVAVFDRTGTIVARNHEPDKAVGTKVGPTLLKVIQGPLDPGGGIYQSVNRDGIPMSAAVKLSPATGFGVAIGIPTAVLWRDTLANGAIPIAGLMVAAICLLLAWSLSQALRRRRQSEFQLRRFVDDSPAALAMFDRDMRCLAVSRRWCQDHGHGDRNVLGQSLGAIFPDIPERLKTVYRRALAGETIKADEDGIEHRPGEISWLRWEMQPWAAEDGEIQGVVLFTEGITARHMAEAALHKAMAWNQAVIESSTDAIIGKALDGTITSWNPAAAEIFGYRDIEVLGKSINILIPVEDEHEEADILESIRRGERIIHYEARRLRKDGRIIYVSISASPVCDETGTIVGASKIARDITGRRRDEERIRQLSLAVEQSPDSIIITNLDAEIEYVNAAFLSCTGYSPAEVIGRNPRILQSGKTPGQTTAELWNALTTGQSWKGEFYNRRKDGSEYVDFANISPIRQADGRITHFVGVQEDITEKKQLALELDQYRNHLEDLVALRTQQLSAAKTSAETANVAKSAFLANMSHEIRTPLNAILGFAQVGIRDSREPKSQDYFARIQGSGDGLLQVIDDILDISKLQASGVSLEHISMVPGDIIDRSLQLVTLRAQAKGLTMTVRETADLPVECLGDPGRLRQVLTNLLTNAVKFTPTGGSVTLTVAREPEEMVFTVSDSGIGIATADVERLFQPFEQADTATTRQFGGTGLGLSISRQLVDLMGGTMTVQSVAGRGSYFAVRLPLLGEVPAPPLDELAVIAVSLPDAETEILADGFARCDAVPDLDQLPGLGPSPGPTLVVVDGVMLTTAAARIEAALGRGMKLAAVLDPGHPPLATRWATDLMVVERPLRCRHLRQAWSAPKPAPRPEPLTARLAGLVVLAAEDNEVNRMVLEDILRGEGAEVILCEDGKQALERVRQCGGQGFNVLVTDIQMPEMDGYGLARAVTELVPDLPIIGLTAHAMAEDRESCLAAGMVEHISKPVKLDHLVEAILRHAAVPMRPPLIDKAVLMARYGDRRDFLSRLVETMRSAHDRTATRLREAAATGDLQSLRSLAHTVKGSAGNLQADRLQIVAADAEQAARDGADDAPAKAQMLAEALDELMTALKQWQDAGI